MNDNVKSVVCFKFLLYGGHATKNQLLELSNSTISTRKILGIFPFLSSNRGKLYLSAHFLLLISCQAEVTRLQENRPDQVPAEEHAQLKDKVRDLENCLHEMQEEFEEVVLLLI